VFWYESGLFFDKGIVNTEDRSHIFCPIFMKNGQKICNTDICAQFGNDSVRLKTWLPGGGAFFLIWL